MQLALRLLIPGGSHLLELEDVATLAGPLDDEQLGHPWTHPDPRVDELQVQVQVLAERAEALLRQNAVPVLVGDERLLHKAAALGAAGSICGVPNLYPGRFARILDTAREDAALIDEVTRIVSLPIIPALKTMLAEQRNDPVWERVRPPLTPLASEDRAELLSSMKVMA